MPPEMFAVICVDMCMGMPLLLGVFRLCEGMARCVMEVALAEQRDTTGVTGVTGATVLLVRLNTRADLWPNRSFEKFLECKAVVLFELRRLAVTFAVRDQLEVDSLRLLADRRHLCRRRRVKAQEAAAPLNATKVLRSGCPPSW